MKITWPFRQHEGQHARTESAPAPRRRWPERFDELAHYNSLTWRGYMYFDPLYRERMRQLQAEYDLWKQTAIALGELP